MENPLKDISWGKIIIGAAVVTAIAAAFLFTYPAAITTMGASLSGAASSIGTWVTGATAKAGAAMAASPWITLGVTAAAGALATAGVVKAGENAALVNSMGAPSGGGVSR